MHGVLLHDDDDDDDDTTTKDDLISHLVDLEYDDYKPFTVEKLKVICSAYGLRKSGRKDDLIRRIMEHYQQQPPAPVEEDEKESDSSTETHVCLHEGDSDSEESDFLLSEDDDADSDSEEAGDDNSAPLRAPPPTIVDYCFDRSQNHALVAATELRHPHDKVTAGLAISTNDVDTLLAMMPAAIQEALQERNDIQKSQLMEIVLDLGRQPSAWVIVPTEPTKNQQDTRSTSARTENQGTVNKDGDSSKDSSTLTQSSATSDTSRTPSSSTQNRRIYIGDANLKVTRAMLDSVSQSLTFGQDNRAGLDGTLHRISAVRNRDGRIVGLTLRVGRHVPGNALMVADLLYRQPNLSILFVGPPGTGKTSIIRDAARMLAERWNVVIVDTSCEIGGAGDVPHACIGRSRRMQVSSINRQASVMIECVQNHTPQVMVIDEIGRVAEVQAALTCRERGVRILASAHGTMAGLVRNTQLCDLLGGVETVTVGDMTAKKQAQGSFGSRLTGAKLRAERRGPPIFDVVIELKPGQLHEWHIVYPTGAAVDSILSTGVYSGQLRRRGVDDVGHLHIRATQVDANRDKILEEARLRDTPFAQNRVPRPNSHAEANDKIPTGDETSCPVCRSTFAKRNDMLQHVLGKKSCLGSLGAQQRASLMKQLHKEAKAL